MSNSDDPKPEFSIRDQFAGRPDALATSAPPPGSPTPGASSPRPAPAGQPPLRRPVTAENLVQHIDWIKLARGVLRRAWLIGLLTLAAAAVGVTGAVLAGRPKYEARTSLLYRSEHQKDTLASAGSSFAVRGLGRTTAMSLLRRTTNMETIRTTLKLSMAAEELRWHLETKSEKNSEIVLLSVSKMPSQELAVKVANEAARVALADNRDFYRAQAGQAAQQFLQQTRLARQEIETLSEQLTTFQTSHRLLEATADTKAFLDSLATISERLSTARIADESQRVRIENYRKIIAELPDETLREAFEDNPLKRRLSNTEVALMEARARYGPDNPRVQTLEDEIKELRRALAGKTFDENRERVYEPNPTKRLFKDELLKLTTEKIVLERTVQQVMDEMAMVEKKYAYLPQQQLELAGFIQRRSAAMDMCQALEKSANNARIAAELDLCDFELLEPSRSAEVSHSKVAMLLPILALVAGFIGGTVLSLALELLDSKVRTVRQIELAYSVPCLAAVAKSDAADLEDAFLPMCRELYARWGQPASAADGAQLLAVLSAQTGEGKSTLAFQIARYWAGLGVKTAYLDFDAAANSVLRPPATLRGIEEYLADRVAWESVSYIQNNVVCFKIQSPVGDLPERLRCKAMARLLETLRAGYGCVVVDTPAVLEGRSAEILALAADRALWVIAAAQTERTAVNLAFDDLERAGVRPMGIVLNFVEPAVAGRKRG